MNILDDIMSKLETDLVSGGATGWASSKSFMPTAPDKVVAVFDVGGRTADQSESVHQFDDVSFQARVRAEEYDYLAAATKMDEVFASLNNTTIPGYTYIFAESVQPIPLGLDKNNRPELVITFAVMKQR